MDFILGLFRYRKPKKVNEGSYLPDDILNLIADTLIPDIEQELIMAEYDYKYISFAAMDAYIVLKQHTKEPFHDVVHYLSLIKLINTTPTKKEVIHIAIAKKSLPALRYGLNIIGQYDLSIIYHAICQANFEEGLKYFQDKYGTLTIENINKWMNYNSLLIR
jgi:hypothetical protein